MVARDNNLHGRGTGGRSWRSSWGRAPILSPDMGLPWAQDQIRNPGVVWDGKKFRLLFTGVPIATDDGWLMLYHAVDIEGTYRVGLLLVDRENPTKVIARTPDPIMAPTTAYEREGYYKLGLGCIFPCANVLIGDELFIYYGAVESRCCVATARLSELLKHVLAHRWEPTDRSQPMIGVAK